MTPMRPRYQLVRMYLGWHACTTFGFGLELLVAPRRLITGPSTSTVYGLASPRLWGFLFLALAAICAFAVIGPRSAWRFGVLALGLAQTCWALALVAPLVTDGRTNLLASAPWVALAATTAVVAHHTLHEERRPAVPGRG